MAFDLDESELIATRVNNKAASWKEVEEYIEKYYVKKDKVRKKIEELDKEITPIFTSIKTLKIFLQEIFYKNY